VPRARLELVPGGALHASCHAVPRQYHLMGVILSAGGALRWYRDVIGAPGVAGGGDDAYEALMAAAAEVAPGAEGLTFLPYLAGERTPHMDPDARGAWIGLSLAHERRHLVRAVLEGVGFALEDALVLMDRLGVRPEQLYAVGGGARSAVWRRILAAILGLPLQRLAVEEGPALGAALLAAVGAGVHADVAAAVDAAVRPAGAPEPPDPDWVARYRPLHQRYAALYPALKAAGAWAH
jgi:xylulokinase